MIEPPCTDPYARWCERSASQLMGCLLLDCYVTSVASVTERNVTFAVVMGS